MREWVAAGKLIEELDSSHEPFPNIDQDTCKKECALPIQFGLPCKCFLYHCSVKDEIISSTLIYPRWFFDDPPYVTGDSWRMRYSDFCDTNFSSPGSSTTLLPKAIDRYQDHGIALVERISGKITSLRTNFTRQ